MFTEKINGNRLIILKLSFLVWFLKLKTQLYCSFFFSLIKYNYHNVSLIMINEKKVGLFVFSEYRILSVFFFLVVVVVKLMIILRFWLWFKSNSMERNN